MATSPRLQCTTLDDAGGTLITAAAVVELHFRPSRQTEVGRVSVGARAIPKAKFQKSGLHAFVKHLQGSLRRRP